MRDKAGRILMLLFLLSCSFIYAQTTKYTLEMDGHDCSGSDCNAFHLKMSYPQDHEVIANPFYGFYNSNNKSNWVGWGDIENAVDYPVVLKLEYDRDCGRSGNYPRIHIFHNRTGKRYQCFHYPCYDEELLVEDNADHVIDFANGHEQEYTIPANTYITMWIYTECTESDVTITAGCRHYFSPDEVTYSYAKQNKNYHRKICDSCGVEVERNLPHVIDHSSKKYSDDGTSIEYKCQLCPQEDSCSIHSLIDEKKGDPYGNLYKVLINGSDDNPFTGNSTPLADYVYKDLIDTDNSAKSTSGSPFINFFIPKDGDFSVTLRTTGFTNYFRNLNSNSNKGKINVLGHKFTIYNSDRIYRVEGSRETLIYKYDFINENVLVNNNKIEKSDTGTYTSQNIFLKEVNRYGLTRYHKIEYRFCNVFPTITLSATDGSSNLSLVPDTGNVAKKYSNTLHQNFNPRFKLKYICNKSSLSGNSAQKRFLEPEEYVHGSKIEKYADSAWTLVKSYNNSSYDNNKFNTAIASNEYILNNILRSSGNNKSILSKLNNANQNTNIVQKYRLTVNASNKMGNRASDTICFYLDYGVDASPRLRWEYGLPTKPVIENERVLGKTTPLEIDFNSLAAGSEIVNLQIFDNKNFKPIEGFRGNLSGVSNNKAKVFLKIIPGNPISSQNSIYTEGSYAVNQPGKGYAYSLNLLLQHFMQQNNINSIERNPMLIQRTIENGDEEIHISRTENVPYNIWNIDFDVHLVCRDWIGNEKNYSNNSIDKVSHADFTYTFNNKKLYTPAYCPDIDITTIYIKGINNIINGVPEVLNPQPGETELEITVLPTYQDFTNTYNINVERNSEVIYSSENTPDTINKENNLVKIDNILYGLEHVFKVSAVNSNGYETEPGSESAFTFDRHDLTINVSGALVHEITDWNWSYRMMGDVIVPQDKTLNIIPGGSVQVPKVYADRKTKIIVKSGGKLVIDGSLHQPDQDTFNVQDNILNKNAFINLAPSGLDARFDQSSHTAETVYFFDGENNWGGIYLEAGYHPESMIRRARITGAYDGIIVYGPGSGTAPPLKIRDCLIMSNYIGVHAVNNSKVNIIDSVIGAQKEYGIKTDGQDYSIILQNVVSGQLPNKYGDYYTGKKYRRYTFEKLSGDQNKAAVEQGGN